MNNFIDGVCVAAGTDPESGATRLIVEVPANVLRDGPPMVYQHVRVALNYCLTCMGKGILHTGIMESPTTICHACSGHGAKQDAIAKPLADALRARIAGGAK